MSVGNVYHDLRIMAFFEKNKDLFPNCPFRQKLFHVHQLSPEYADGILRHMLGHFLDYQTGEPCRNEANEIISAINQDGIADELRHVYNLTNNPKLNEAIRLNPDVDPNDRPEFLNFGPEQRGCFGADARAELMAEAIRAYTQNPNSLKTFALKVADRICLAVNGNPKVNRVIQFN